MINYRWNPYVLLTGDEIKGCFSAHFRAESKTLLIMNKGFDVRMNVALKHVLENSKKHPVEILLISFDEGEESSSQLYRDAVEQNMAELKILVDEGSIREEMIELWAVDGDKKRRVGDRKAAKIVDGINILEYTDIIVDISALPRGIYFSMIGKLLTVIDNLEAVKKPNLLVTVAENPELDAATNDDTPDPEPNFLQGFSVDIDQSAADSQAPLIWMPILGENKAYQIKQAYSYLGPAETCPILPFPSRDPRRPDALIIDYHGLLFDEFVVEQQNIMYVPEQNPFEAYRILTRAIANYYKSLSTLGNTKIVLSTFSSKLLSIGTLLAAYEIKANENGNETGVGVGVLNVDSQGYKINPAADLEKMRNESNLFVIWLTGEPYEIETTNLN
jgi:hypothetical protein